MSTIYFGWRLPAFPADDSRGATFVQQIHADASVANQYFESVWVADNFVPWAISGICEIDYCFCFFSDLYARFL